MKQYKQILEAINRGIQFALDDFEPEDIQVSKPKHETITKEDSLYQNLLLKEHVVDLGLPSGTLWCKYNLDVNPNQLSKSEDWYGAYYAWGELKGNKINKDGEIYFGWNNYKFGNYNKLTKYCNNSTYGLKGFADNLTELLPEDDAAFQFKKLYNFKFHIPTKEQIDELLKYTHNYWVNNYNPNKLVHNLTDDGGIQGLNGRVFVGKNKKQLFIPAAGFHYESDIKFVGSYCDLWSSSLYLLYPNNAYYLFFSSDDIIMNDHVRYIGQSIRPVITYKNYYKSL